MNKGQIKHIVDYLKDFKALKEWANPEPPEMSGSQWQGRMFALVDMLRELGSFMDVLIHWDANIGNELKQTGISLMKQAANLAQPDPVLYPLDSIEYSTRVTNLRDDTYNFAERLQALATSCGALATEEQAETGKTYTGKEAFIEKLSEIANLETPLYPFKAGKIQYWNLTDKPGHLKYGSYRFSKDDCDVIENTVGFPLTISKLRAFLVKNCSVQDPINYNWPDIIAALSLYRNDLASLKPVGTEQEIKKTIPKKKGRPRKYSPEIIKAMEKAYQDKYGEINDSKGAWSYAAEIGNAPTGDAARIACANYRKNNKLK